MDVQHGFDGHPEEISPKRDGGAGQPRGREVPQQTCQRLHQLPTEKGEAEASLRQTDLWLHICTSGEENWVYKFTRAD